MTASVLVDGLTYDNKQNLYIPKYLPQPPEPRWAPLAPHQSDPIPDLTGDKIHRFVFYNRESSQTKEDLLNSFGVQDFRMSLHYRRGTILVERMVHLKEADLYALEFIYVIQDTNSKEYKLQQQRLLYNGLTFEEEQLRRKMEKKRQADERFIYYSRRLNPVKYLEKRDRKRALKRKLERERLQRKQERARRKEEKRLLKEQRAAKKKRNLLTKPESLRRFFPEM